jgi:hypothetical protein
LGATNERGQRDAVAGAVLRTTVALAAAAVVAFAIVDLPRELRAAVYATAKSAVPRHRMLRARDS